MVTKIRLICQTVRRASSPGLKNQAVTVMMKMRREMMRKRRTVMKKRALMSGKIKMETIGCLPKM